MYKRPAAILGLAIIILLCASASRAAVQQSSTSGKAADDASVEPGSVNKAAVGVPSNQPAMEDRLRALEEIVERQQREIRALRELVEKRDVAVSGERAKKPAQAEAGQMEKGQTEVARAEAAPVETARAEAAQADPAGGKAQDDVSQKRLDELYRKFGSIRISGDIRFRAETFNNQGFDSPNEPPFRDRLRIRARLALDGVINEHFDWGLRLATGVRTDVNSTNQTLTDFFERKEFTLDRAFIRYDSKGERVGVQLVAGRFEPTFRRTQMVWDEDVNVEGASEAVYFKTDSSLRQVKLVAFQLPFDEEPSAKDGVLYGGQLQTDWQLSPTVSAGFNVAHYNWNRPDLILRAIVPFAGSGTGDGQVITVATTNTVIRDANGRPIGFLPNFNLFDVLGTLRWEAAPRWPVALTFDFVRNLTSRIDDEENGVWAAIQVGQFREKGDWRFGYTYTRIERDAVLVPFNFSDILASNSRNHIPRVGYQIADRVTFQWTGLFSQRIVKQVQDTPFNRYLKRMQFDLVYRF